MGYLAKYLLTVTCDATSTNSTGATESTNIDWGFLHSIQYVESTSSLDSAAEVVFTGTVTGNTFLTAVTTAGSTNVINYYPRGLASLTTGASTATNAANNTVLLPIVNECLRVEVSSGGNSAVANFYVYVQR